MSGSNSSNPAAPAAASRLEPLHLTVHAMPNADPAHDDAARRTTRGRLKMLLVLLACAAPVLASYFSYYVLRPSARSNYATLIEPSRTLPAGLPLTDLEGRRVDPLSLKGQWQLIVLGRSACDSDCEQRLFMQRQLREMTGRERERVDKLWLITDGGPIAPALLAAVQASPATRVLRVSGPALQQWLAAAPGESLESHLYIVDPMGQWMMRAPPQPDPAKLKRDLERLLRASAFWDRPGP